MKDNLFLIHHSAFRIPHSAFRIPHSAFPAWASGRGRPTSNLCILTAPERAPNIRLLK
jgi:hypothetical protein